VLCLHSGIDTGEKDLPHELLEYLYNSMVTTEIKMLQGPSGSTEKSAGMSPWSLQPVSILLLGLLVAILPVVLTDVHPLSSRAGSQLVVRG
jgi:hypothetical protein